MKSKNIVTAILLAFVVVSVAVLVLRESRGPAEPNSSTQSVAETETATDSEMAVLLNDTKSTLSSASEKAAELHSETVSNSAKSEHAKPVKSSRVTDRIPASPKVVVYYFHGNTRCITCRKIESFAKSAVESGFASELKTGQIEFRVVNVEEPDNEHFVQDYQLVTRSVVLSRVQNGTQQGWKNLDQVWTLVRDPEAFQRYVVDETKQLLGGA